MAMERHASQPRMQHQGKITNIINKVGNRSMTSTNTTLFNIVMEVLANTII